MHSEDHDTLLILSADVRALKESVDKFDHKLFGNGQPGELSLLTDRVSFLEKFQTKITTGLTLVGFAVTTFGLALLKHVFSTGK